MRLSRCALLPLRFSGFPVLWEGGLQLPSVPQPVLESAGLSPASWNQGRQNLYSGVKRLLLLVSL